jgi:hypothetical protein
MLKSVIESLIERVRRMRLFTSESRPDVADRLLLCLRVQQFLEREDEPEGKRLGYLLYKA